jgi:hypothetical protein
MTLLGSPCFVIPLLTRLEAAFVGAGCDLVYTLGLSQSTPFQPGCTDVELRDDHFLFCCSLLPDPLVGGRYRHSIPLCDLREGRARRGLAAVDGTQSRQSVEAVDDPDQVSLERPFSEMDGGGRWRLCRPCRRRQSRLRYRSSHQGGCQNR